LNQSRWPKELRGQSLGVKIPRQLPPSYSLIIQQFHRTWNEEEWLTEMQQRYVSLYQITRMRVKDGSPLNAVRADFKSIEEAQTLINHGKISLGSMIHPVKPYYLPIRINKCFKCLRHDHTTRTCASPRLCPKCAEEHSLEHGCPNHEKCVNCGSSDHASGHSACAIVQDKRRALVEQAKKQRADLLVRTEQQLSQYGHREGDFPAFGNHDERVIPPQDQQGMKRSQPTYAQVTSKQRNQAPHNDIEYVLSSFLNKMERRLEELSSHLSSQLCHIERKVNQNAERQVELEKTVNDVILPSIQELGRIVARSVDNRNTQEEVKAINNKINEVISHYKPHIRRNSIEVSSVPPLDPTPNVFRQ
jgi:hypothetical protein